MMFKNVLLTGIPYPMPYRLNDQTHLIGQGFFTTCIIYELPRKIIESLCMIYNCTHTYVYEIKPQIDRVIRKNEMI